MSFRGIQIAKRKVRIQDGCSRNGKRNSQCDFLISKIGSGSCHQKQWFWKSTLLICKYWLLFEKRFLRLRREGPGTRRPWVCLNKLDGKKEGPDKGHPQRHGGWRKPACVAAWRKGQATLGGVRSFRSPALGPLWVMSPHITHLTPPMSRDPENWNFFEVC